MQTAASTFCPAGGCSQALSTIPETVPAPFSERRRGNTSALRAPERNGAFQPRSLAIPLHLMGQILGWPPRPKNPHCPHLVPTTNTPNPY